MNAAASQANSIPRATCVQVCLGTLAGDTMHDALVDALNIARERGIDAMMHAPEAYDIHGRMTPNGSGAPRLTVIDAVVTAYDLVNEARDRAARRRFWTRCQWVNGVEYARQVASVVANGYSAADCGRNAGNVNLTGFGPLHHSVLNWTA